jgi:dihydrofolate synthase/folylpolyglutamate synthase
LAGQTAPVDALVRAAERVARADPDLTQFDAQVISAFLLFADTAADLVLLETGMGGRLDSTNVIRRPALTLITPIALDHQDALGPTLAHIAAHKAGIIKSNVPVMVTRQPPEALEVIEAAAEHAGSLLLNQGVQWDAFENAGRLVVQTQSRALDLPLPALHGQHQIHNAGLACAAMLHLFDFEGATFSQGVRSARWPGRLHPLTRGALSAPVRANGGEVWVDGGHNAHAAQALAETLRAMAGRRPAPTIAVIGMLARKQSDAFIGALAGVVDLMIAVPMTQAFIPPALMTAQANALGVAAVASESLEDAMHRAAQFPAPRVVICGSLVLAAEALAAEGA